MSLKVVVPARFGSSRLPGKPLVDLCGEPMIVRVARRTMQALPTAELVVATDDHRIESVLNDNGISSVLTSTEHTSGTDRIEEVASLKQWGDDELILNVQGDEPLIPIDLLRGFADYCESLTGFQLATLACPISSHAQLQDSNVVKVIRNKECRAIYFSRHPVPFCRDRAVSDWPLEPYLRHVGIYAYRRKALKALTAERPCVLESLEKLEQLRALWLSIPIDVMLWHSAPPHGVDTPEDVSRVVGVLEGLKNE